MLERGVCLRKHSSVVRHGRGDETDHVFPPGGLFTRCAFDQGKASTCGQRQPLASFLRTSTSHVSKQHVIARVSVFALSDPCTHAPFSYVLFFLCVSRFSFGYVCCRFVYRVSLLDLTFPVVVVLRCVRPARSCQRSCPDPVVVVRMTDGGERASDPPNNRSKAPALLSLFSTSPHWSLMPLSRLSKMQNFMKTKMPGVCEKVYASICEICMPRELGIQASRWSLSRIVRLARTCDFELDANGARGGSAQFGLREGRGEQ